MTKEINIFAYSSSRMFARWVQLTGTSGYKISSTIYICICHTERPPLWSSGQNSSLQIQRFGFDSWHYEIFRKVVGVERGSFSLMSTTEELL
jgi:hypothetical protein